MFSPDEPYFDDEDLYTLDMKTASAINPGHHPHHGHHVTPTRVSIKEANEHLQLLHQRVSDLEDIIRSQGMALSEKEVTYRRQLLELKESKERHIEDLSRTILRLEERNRTLERDLKTKVNLVDTIKEKNGLLKEFVLKSMPPLEQLVIEMKQMVVKLDKEQSVLVQEVVPVIARIEPDCKIRQELILQELTKPRAEPEVSCILSSLATSLTSNLPTHTASKASSIISGHDGMNSSGHSLDDSPVLSIRPTRQLPELTNAINVNNADSGHPSSSNNSDSGQTNYTQVLLELKGHYEHALRRELDREAGDDPLEPVSEPLPIKSSSKAHSGHGHGLSRRSLRKHSLTSTLNNGSGPLTGPASLSTSSPTGSGSSTPNSRRRSVDSDASTMGKAVSKSSGHRDLMGHHGNKYSHNSAVNGSSSRSGHSVQHGIKTTATVGKSFGINFNYSEDDDEPPPPAPGNPRLNTNDTLPSIQAPTARCRYYQSSY